MVLIDTSAWVEYFRGESGVADVVDRCLREEQVVIGDLVWCEVLQGIRSSQQRREVARLFSALPQRNLVGFEVADQAAVNYRLLRREGLTIRKTIDVIIGTFCCLKGLRLVHNDRDFEHMAPLIGLLIMSS